MEATDTNILGDLDEKALRTIADMGIGPPGKEMQPTQINVHIPSHQIICEVGRATAQNASLARWNPFTEGDTFRANDRMKYPGGCE